MTLLRTLPACMIVALAAGCTSSVQAQEIDGSKDPGAIADQDAYVLLFAVLRIQPPPHWDFDTKVNYLKDECFSPVEAAHLVHAATRYFTDTAAVDNGTARLNETSGQVEFARLHNARGVVLGDAITELRSKLTLEGNQKLDRQIRRVKQGAKVSGPDARQPWETVARRTISYIATAHTADGLSIAATGVATTYGHFGENARITVAIWSPGKTRCVLSEPSFGPLAQATAYMPLCEGTVCEDGDYYAQSGPRESCPVRPGGE